MLSIAESISDLLFLNDVVVVPGLGAFVRKDGSASANVITHQLERPTSEILFDANLREDNDMIANYMSSSNDISMDEARELLLRFVSDTFSDMKSGKTVTLAKIGTLAFEASREIVFEADGSVNYHPDAFGLESFSAVPVFQSKTKAEIKTEIEQQQKDKNTPMTVDKKAVHQDKVTVDEKKDAEDDRSGRHRGWLWVLLSLLLLGGTLFGLHYFEVIDLNLKEWYKEFVFVVNQEEEDWRKLVQVTDTVTDAEMPLQKDTSQIIDSNAAIVDTAKPQAEQQPLCEENQNEKSNEEVHEKPTGPRYLVVFGCFSMEENAEALLKSMKKKGCNEAFMRRRGKVWDVYSGSYATMEDAKAAMRDLKSVTDAKVWILQSKE